MPFTFGLVFKASFVRTNKKQYIFFAFIYIFFLIVLLTDLDNAQWIASFASFNIADTYLFLFIGTHEISIGLSIFTAVN